jgi:hypothetical protein
MTNFGCTELQGFYFSRPLPAERLQAEAACARSVSHPDDDRVIRCAVEAFKRVPPLGAELDVVDVGTAPNLIPLFCTLPRARQMTV